VGWRHHSACHGSLEEVKRCAPWCSGSNWINLAEGRIKEAGPEALVQLRNLTVVERASEQLMAPVLRFGVG
jgi:hypothetical protein